jgi:sulfhydrogenase subunit beta (sulfur reductase)
MSSVAKILVADDEPSVLSGIQKGLSKHGYFVATAKDGLEAAEKLAKERFDLVLSDLKMPKADGIELLNRAKEIDRNIPFIMLTGYGTKENALLAMKLGAYDYIPKPFTINELTEVVNRAVKENKSAVDDEKIISKKISSSRISEFVEFLMKKNDVVAPIARGNGNIFARLEDSKSASLEYVTTTLPPKKFLLPVEEELFKFNREKGTVESGKREIKPTVLLGIHPADMQGILRLDQAFTEGYPEANYIERRKNTAIVGVLPKTDSKSFANDMGAGDTKAGFDLFMTKVFDTYIVDILTSKGKKLIDDYDGFEELGKEDVDQAKAVKKAKMREEQSLGCQPKDIQELVKMASDDKIWKELSAKCLSCGSCSLVCPTCYCFDVTDKLSLNLKEGARYRKWDSCQTDMFATVAGGENFREHREQRLKHRFMHKFSYFAGKFGTNMCVGCGRCARACVAGINPIDVIQKLSKEYGMLLVSKVFKYMN